MRELGRLSPGGAIWSLDETMASPCMAGLTARRPCRLIPGRTRSLLACIVAVACLLGGAIHINRGARLRREAVVAVARGRQHTL